MRQVIILLILSLALPNLARANDAALFEATAELPEARVLCVGAADFPEMLRFAFQAEPESNGRPEVFRTATRRDAEARRTSPRAVTPRAVARNAARAGPPVLRLPCVQG